MKYNEVLIKIKSSDGEAASNIASMLDVGGLYLEDYSDMMDCQLVKSVGIIDDDLLNKDRTRATLHVYLSRDINLAEATEYLKERYTDVGIEYEISLSQIDEDEYATSWKKFYKPFKVGEHIVVVPEWEKYDAKEGEIPLVIDPGMAFGTGSHETTSSCIEAVQKYVKADDTVLDVGCGSGILSISALLMGAKEATGLDVDSIAVEVSKRNAALNTFNGAYYAYKCNILEEEPPVGSKKFNVVTANIVADIIIMLSGIIGKYIEENGYFIVSGIITERAPEVVAALEKNNFKIIDSKENKGWMMYVATAK